MYLEILFLIFFGLGYAFLRIDKLPRRTGAGVLDGKLKAMRDHVSANRYDAALQIWREMKCIAPTPMEALRLAMQCALTQANHGAIREIAAHVAKVDPRKCAGDKRNLDTTGAYTYIVNGLLQVCSLRRNQTVSIAAITDLFSCIPFEANAETCEHVAVAHARAGDVAAASAALSDAPSARALGAIAAALLKSGRSEEAMLYLRKVAALGPVPPSIVTEFVRASDARAATVCALSALPSVRISPDVASLAVEEAARRRDVDAASNVMQVVRKAGVQLPYVAYDSLVKLYAGAASLKAIEYYDEMAASGYEVAEGSVVGIVSSCAPVKFMKLAEHVVRQRKEAGLMSLQVYSALMKVYAYSKLYDQCCDLYKQVLADGIEPDEVMKGCVLNFAARAGNTDLADELFRTQRPSGPVEVQNYMSQIRACRQSKNASRAISLYQELLSKGILANAAFNCFNSVLDVCVVSGELERAERLFHDESVEGLDIVAYNTLVKGYCNAGAVEKVQAFFALMRERGFPPNDVSYNSLMNVHVRQQAYGAAWQLLQTMREDGIPEDAYTISTLVKALKQCSDATFTRRVLSLLDSTEVDITKDEVTVNVVLDAFVRCRDMQRLTGLCERIKEAKMNPSVAMISTLIKAFSSLRRIDDALALWHEMTAVREMVPNEIALGCVIDALVSHNRVEEAVEMLAAWKGRIACNCVIYSTVLKGFAISRQPARARAVFEAMQAEGIKPNLVAFNTLLDCFARAGEVGPMQQCFEEAGSYGLTPDRITFATVLKGFCLQGQVAQARAIVAQMQKRNVPVDAIVYNTLLDGCVRSEALGECDAILAEMLAKGVQPTTFTVTVLIKRYGQGGALDEAFAVAERMPRQYNFALTTQVMTCLITACLNNREFDRAFAVFRRMQAKEWPAPDALTYDKLVLACVRQGSLERACALVRDAYGIPRGPRVGLDGQVLDRLIHALAKGGKSEALAIPLVQDLRKAGAQLSHKVIAASLHGAMTGSRRRY